MDGLSYWFPELEPGTVDGWGSSKLAEQIHLLPSQDLHIVRELDNLRGQAWSNNKGYDITKKHI